MTHSTDISGSAGIGRAGFVAEHGLHTEEQQAAAEASWRASTSSGCGPSA